MSQSVYAVEEQCVVASLQPGPKGTIRLSYEYPNFDMGGYFLEGFALGAKTQYAHAFPVIEIDHGKLQRLQFSQEELAEIGFSLVVRLSALLHHSSGGRNT